MDPEGTLMSNTNVGHAGEAEWRKGQESSEVQNYRNTPFSWRTVLCALRNIHPLVYTDQA